MFYLSTSCPFLLFDFNLVPTRNRFLPLIFQRCHTAELKAPGGREPSPMSPCSAHGVWAGSTQYGGEQCWALEPRTLSSDHRSAACLLALIPHVSCPFWVPQGDSSCHTKSLYCLDVASWMPWTGICLRSFVSLTSKLLKSQLFSFPYTCTLSPRPMPEPQPCWLEGTGPGLKHVKGLGTKTLRFRRHKNCK